MGHKRDEILKMFEIVDCVKALLISSFYYCHAWAWTRLQKCHQRFFYHYSLYHFYFYYFFLFSVLMCIVLIIFVLILRVAAATKTIPELHIITKVMFLQLWNYLHLLSAIRKISYQFQAMQSFTPCDYKSTPDNFYE